MSSTASLWEYLKRILFRAPSRLDNDVEKREFQSSKQEAREAREYARQSIATVRRNQRMWMEDALTPYDPRRMKDRSGT